MRKIIPIFTILFLLLSAVPLTADAGIVQCGFDGSKGQPIDGKIDNTEACGFCDIFKLINNIVIFLLVPSPSVNNGAAVVPLLATLFILIGGFYILFVGGSPVEVFKDTGAKGNILALKKGKDIITAVIVGLLVVYIAWIVVSSILTFLGVAQWTGLLQWWDIKCGL